LRNGRAQQLPETYALTEKLNLSSPTPLNCLSQIIHPSPMRFEVLIMVKMSMILRCYAMWYCILSPFQRNISSPPPGWSHLQNVDSRVTTLKITNDMLPISHITFWSDTDNLKHTAL
jgi:hypothetical protein